MYILDTISLNSLKVENNRAAFSSSFGKYIVKKEFYQKLKKEEEKLQSGIFLILDYEKDKRRIETLIKEFPLYLKRWTGDKTIDKNESLLLALGKERSSEKIPSLYCIPRRIVQLTDFYILKNDSIVQDIQKMTTDNVKEREENKLFEFLGELSSQY
ncbi:MAG: hypothetical protein LBM19_03030, partial [Holosporales bacterium]|nr:hypothetical protein [Holosporales bacterium]